MPRKARKMSNSCFYHVMVQGINKEHIFNKEEYVKKYRKLMQEKLQDSEVTILAYCIMINHVHLLIYSKESQDLSKYMQKINMHYSHYYNKLNARVGYVFRDRYRSQEILDLRQLYNCLRYIHNNPVKAGIVKNVNEYPYSSYNEFIGNKVIINEESLKLLFGTKENYLETFNLIHFVNKEEEEKFIDIKEKNIVDFVNEVEEKYSTKINEIKKEKGILKSVIKEARIQTDATLVELALMLDISKSTVANYDK